MNKMRAMLATALTILALGAAQGAAAETLEVVGTGDGTNVLKSLGNAFGEANPGVTVEVPPSIGSGGAIKTVGADKSVLGRVARGIKDKEKPYGLEYLAFARVPVVFFVNKGVAVSGLTTAQVLDIYSGKVTSWDGMGDSGKIRVVRREDGDSSLENLQKQLAGFKDITLLEKSKTANSTPEAFETVQSTAGAIGFGPYDVAKLADVKVLTLDGKNPLDEGYPVVTTLGLVFKPANRTGTVAKFLDYVTGDSVAALLQEAGARPAK